MGAHLADTKAANGGQETQEDPMIITNRISRLSRALSRARTRWITERAIADLSPELRKDIGWPDLGRDRMSGANRWSS